MVVQLDKDDPDPDSYAQMVNGIFAAQRQGVTIDSFVLRESWQDWADAILN
eukprot:CAMPEP_0168621854 /NCGR_PEP_ID=MMETSP0449_2-20121227/7931_1 /TAXON_ID=1082188 /ORGANISM="Strombidium rassoulzadegani, Strain ras09" /LENGTH=50 /DNA_ID=CAMNT_0008663031 /DNA_START=415 /DNA_END=567 /DNA_ORIENTATION=-